MGRVGDDAVAVLAVRGEHAVGSGEMGAGAWHRASSRSERHFRGGETGDAKSAGMPICTAGGCPGGVRHTDVPHEFDGVEHDMGGAVTEGVLESIHDLPAVVDREAFVGDGRAGDGAAQAFEGFPVMGFAPGTCMEGESRELERGRGRRAAGWSRRCEASGPCARRGGRWRCGRGRRRRGVARNRRRARGRGRGSRHRGSAVPASPGRG